MANTPDARDGDDLLKIWREAYEDQVNGIEATLQKLINDHIAFSCFVKILDDEVKRTQGKPRLKSTLMILLRDGYFASAILGLGKLTETQSNDPRKAVYSIKALLKDVVINQKFITRDFFKKAIWGGGAAY